jgi:hypothetical protein
MNRFGFNYMHTYIKSSHVIHVEIKAKHGKHGKENDLDWPTIMNDYCGGIYFFDFCIV